MSIIQTDALTSDELLPYHSLNEAQLYHYFEPDDGDIHSRKPEDNRTSAANGVSAAVNAY